jgi:hypothetical protein
MVLFTQIARLTDGLPLCATTEDWAGAVSTLSLAAHWHAVCPSSLCTARWRVIAHEFNRLARSSC